MWIYEGPIYNLNRIITLQAVVDCRQCHSHSPLVNRHPVLQLRLGLDFLLARQGGFCVALNLTGGACCFNISDHAEAIRNFEAEIEKVAHVPVPT
uniref:Uncharacterized protein n=1 Tax=Podarcis muralis TaxID=64176 RepID=A0A670KFS8_PODMU